MFIITISLKVVPKVAEAEAIAKHVLSHVDMPQRPLELLEPFSSHDLLCFGPSPTPWLLLAAPLRRLLCMMALEGRCCFVCLATPAAPVLTRHFMGVLSVQVGVPSRNRPLLLLRSLQDPVCESTCCRTSAIPTTSPNRSDSPVAHVPPGCVPRQSNPGTWCDVQVRTI